MATFRCPKDDLVFDTMNDHSRPHHHSGHRECPGPHCRSVYERKLSAKEKADIARIAADSTRKQAADAVKIAQQAAKDAEAALLQAQREADREEALAARALETEASFAEDGLPLPAHSPLPASIQPMTALASAASGAPVRHTELV